MTSFFPPHLPHLGESYFRRWKKIPKGFYRITVKAVAMNPEWEILLLKEERYGDKKSEFYREDGGMYDLPGGGLSWWEDFHLWLLREVVEEMWIDQDDFEIADAPLYVQISELDDRYHDDTEKDDFYPVLMMYYPVKFHHLDFQGSRECESLIWMGIEKFREKEIWSHTASLANIFKRDDFPKEFITSQTHVW